MDWETAGYQSDTYRGIPGPLNQCVKYQARRRNAEQYGKPRISRDTKGSLQFWLSVPQHQDRPYRQSVEDPCSENDVCEKLFVAA